MIDEQRRQEAAVDLFAAEMKRKLVEKLHEGFRGWDDISYADDIRENLQYHVERGVGQEVDVATFAMMLWWQQRSLGGPGAAEAE